MTATMHGPATKWVDGLPDWLERARVLYERGFSLDDVATAIPEARSGSGVNYWLSKAGVPIRSTGEGRRLVIERVAEMGVRVSISRSRADVDAFILAGCDYTLDRHLERIAAATTEDQARDYSAFTPGAIRTVTHG